MTVDELVTVIRYDLDQASKNTLEKVDAESRKMMKNSDKVSLAFNKAGKSMDGVTKATSFAASGFLRLSAALTGVVSAGAAFGYSMKSATDAKDLKLFSDAIGISAEELRVLGSTMRASGVDAKGFMNELRAIKTQRGFLNLDDILRDADDLKRIADDVGGLSEAMNRGNVLGYSDQSTRFLAQGSESILAKMEETKRQGLILNQELIDQQDKLATASARLEETFRSTFDRVSAHMAGSMTRGFDGITRVMTDNQSQIDQWAIGASNSLNSVFDGFFGQLDEVEDRLRRLKGKDMPDLMLSPDPEIREKEAEKRSKTAYWENVGDNAMVAIKTAMSLGGGVSGLAQGIWNADIDKMVASVDTAVGEIAETIDRSVQNKLAISSPVMSAEIKGLESTYGSDVFRKIGLAEQYERNPELREQAYTRANDEAMKSFHVNNSTNSYSALFTPPTVFSSVQEAKADYEKNLPDNAPFISPAVQKAVEKVEEERQAYTRETMADPAYREAPKGTPRIGSMAEAAQRVQDDEFRFRHLPPSQFPSSFSELDMSRYASSPGQGGSVTIQHQENHININGNGLDTGSIAKKTLTELNQAAMQNDHIPFVR